MSISVPVFDDESCADDAFTADRRSLDVFDRELISADPATLTADQRERRDRLLGDRADDPAEIERRRRARRDANRLATRLAGSLGIHWLLTPAPARAFFELIRKFAKDELAGRAPVFDQPRDLLARDAGVSLGAFDAMRRIAVAHGWITAAVTKVQVRRGQWRQEPTTYRPGPMARRAIALLIRAEGVSHSTGSQKVAKTGERDISTPLPSPRRDTGASGFENGDAAHRRRAAEPSPCRPGPRPSAPPAASIDARGLTTGEKRRPGANATASPPGSPPPSAVAPPHIADIEALRAIVRAALTAEASGTGPDPARASDAELIGRCDRLRRERCPEISEADWTRAVRARGLWAATALLVALAKADRGRARSPAGVFAWWTWRADAAIAEPSAAAAASIRGGSGGGTAAP